MRIEKTANIKFASSRTYSAWRTSWYSASTDVEQLREHCRPYCWDAAFERSLNMDSTRHSHSYKFS
jgi:hypothetical protein